MALAPRVATALIGAMKLMGALNPLRRKHSALPAIGVVVMVLAGCGETEVNDPSVWDTQVTTTSGEVMNVDLPREWEGDDPPGEPLPEGTELWFASTDGDWQLLDMPECSLREFNPVEFGLSFEEDGDPYKEGYSVEFECPEGISDPAFTVDGMPVP